MSVAKKIDCLFSFFFRACLVTQVKKGKWVSVETLPGDKIMSSDMFSVAQQCFLCQTQQSCLQVLPVNCSYS